MLRTGDLPELSLRAILGRVRWTVLRELLQAGAQGSGIRELARRARTSPGAVHREISLLARVGLAKRHTRGRRVRYALAPEHPLIPGLRRLLAAPQPNAAPGAGQEQSAPAAVLRRAIADDPQLKLGILFGSAATGKLRADSDLDVAVAGDRPLTSRALLGLRDRIALATGRSVDLVDLNAAGDLVALEALRRGAVVYSVGPGLRARLLARALLDRADFGLLRDRLLETRRRRWIGT